MDKFDKLFKDIENKTKKGEIAWEIATYDMYNRFVFNPEQTYRAFYGVYHPNDEQSYDLFLLERKNKTYNDYSDSEYEKYAVYIIIVNDDKLIFNLTAGHVDRQDLHDLADYISENSLEAKDLFSYFEDD